MRLARTALVLALAGACLQAPAQTTSLGSGWSSAELACRSETDLIVNKEIAGYYPMLKLGKSPVGFVSYLSKVRLGLDTFAGYGLQTRSAVMGLAAIFSAPIGGNLSWLVGPGIKVGSTQPLTIASFSLSNVGLDLGVQLSFSG